MRAHSCTERATYTGFAILGQDLTSVESTGAKCFGCTGLRGVDIDIQGSEHSRVDADFEAYRSRLFARAQVSSHRKEVAVRWAWLIYHTFAHARDAWCVVVVV